MSTTNDASVDPARAQLTQPAEGHQIVAVFETYERAREARSRLLDDGIAAADMDLLGATRGAGDANFEYEPTNAGFWTAIKRLFVPEEDAYGYAEGLRRGHAMLVVRPPIDRHDRVVEVLETFNPSDFDQREAEWRTERPATEQTAMERTTREPVEARAREGGLDSPAGALAGGAEPTVGATTEGEEVLPIAQEEVRVGKRQVARGGVRVRTYVVERPVSEDVRLREERVEVNRHKVDRPVGAVPEEAFRERTVEVEAKGEEAVVSKEARVVEEVVIRKDASERVETVRDTERKTEVEVQDDRRAAAPAGTRVPKP